MTKLPDANWRTLLVSVACIIYLVIFKEVVNPRLKKIIKYSFPSELLLVVFIFIYDSHSFKSIISKLDKI